MGGSCRCHPHLGLHHVPLGGNVQAAGAPLTYAAMQAAEEALPTALYTIATRICRSSSEIRHLETEPPTPILYDVAGLCRS